MAERHRGDDMKLRLETLFLNPKNPQKPSHSTYSFHCSSFLGLPFRILYIELVNQKKELHWRL